jgi:hypothetical protein
LVDQGVPRATLTLNADGAGALTFFDPNGNASSGMP